MCFSCLKYNGTIADYIPIRIKELEDECDEWKGNFDVSY